MLFQHRNMSVTVSIVASMDCAGPESANVKTDTKETSVKVKEAAFNRMHFRNKRSVDFRVLCQFCDFRTIITGMTVPCFVSFCTEVNPPCVDVQCLNGKCVNGDCQCDVQYTGNNCESRSWIFGDV